MVMVETHSIPYHICGCGYKTSIHGNASKHKKTKCGHEISVRKIDFVLKEDYDRDVKAPMNVVNGNVGVIDQSVNSIGQNITINLVLPEKSVVSSIYDAIKNQECLDEIRHADAQDIPAILFKYTRGTKAEQQVIKYDSDKNVVRHKDPVTGKDVSKELKKYRNEYLADNADVYDNDFHIPYMPGYIQKAMKQLTKPEFETGKKKDEPIPASEVIKICAAGDHRMYKLPHETKKFYTQVANNIDKEIKSTT
ncbi:protein of unknown function (DUF1390) [Paramecium bursaria Chlorella virus Can18-4]|nr:protein of unknown function (DUF1390) [Paramecium bursaria Chlorella virus Can18-4]